jgi:hypothetical protein
MNETANDAGMGPIVVSNAEGKKASFILTSAVTNNPKDNLYLVHLFVEGEPPPEDTLFAPLPKADAIRRAEQYASEHGWKLTGR